MKSVGEILKSYRIDNCKLLREVAAAINVDSAVLSKIENGSRLPTEEQLKSLIKYYNADEVEINAAYASDKLMGILPEQSEIAEKSIEMFFQKVSFIRPNMSMKFFLNDLNEKKTEEKDNKKDKKKKNT